MGKKNMTDISYKPLIEDMTWSFSRIESFDGCPYRWFMKYIKHYKDHDTFYASYGSFVHKIIELYYRGEITQPEMAVYFLKNFRKEVKGERPKDGIAKKYIENGTEYFKNFKPFPFEFVGVEQKIEFSLDGIPFVGYIDFLGKDGDDFVIVDNKSRDLKQRSKRAKPTVKDRELDEMIRQLYIYSEGVRQIYGKLPTKLCFNCFRNGEFIVEEFNMDAFEEAKRWASETIHRIAEEEYFDPKQELFMCKWLCGVSDKCEYEQEAKAERRWNRLHAGRERKDLYKT